ncbi:DUF1800 domain-containing protein [Erythrobacter crassostreae]|uniref:DUF1800 domain-containing protein n=1 Tax=Erythrobacter crassostreae TaxID=2828328 RepID=A0A9X1F3W2_9SPHN|nr:DUF1800 domain-containing protein [Erythrobacter crassostrea]MBV7259607.1 DUF1800 domain-containing protein [Erythrobacter crassostrea]
MTASHIALSRFGYGLKFGEEPPRDAKRYLLSQIDNFEPKPVQIAGRPDTTELAGKFVDVIHARNRARTIAQDRAESMGMDRTRVKVSLEEYLPQFPAEVRGTYLEPIKALIRDLGFRFDMAAASDTPMMERLVHFWSNHFSVTARKIGTYHQVGNLEFGAIRPKVRGKFGDMMKAAVLHPAMLFYLDQFRSIGPNSPRKRGPGRRGLNENLAREILELHTLGVNGGYSQEDVTEFARALTGWTIGGLRQTSRFAPEGARGTIFIDAFHEPGARTIMGKTYRQQGSEQALAVLDDLATHPSTARFVSTKLARHFAGDVPPESLVRRLERNFLRTGGDLESLTRTLIEAPECWREGPVKFQRPFEWLVASLRFAGGDQFNERQIYSMLVALGEQSWNAPSPAGFDDFEGNWAGPDALIRRVELAERITRRAPFAANILDRAKAAFPGTLSENTRLWLSRAESDRQALGLMLAAPEMMRR